MIRSKSIAIVAAAAGIAVAGSVALAQEAGQESSGDTHQVDGAHKQHQEQGRRMQGMEGRHKQMADMHKQMAEKHNSRKPETEEHKH